MRANYKPTRNILTAAVLGLAAGPFLLALAWPQGTIATHNAIGSPHIEEFEIPDAPVTSQDIESLKKELEKGAGRTATDPTKIDPGCGLLSSLRPGCVIYWILDTISDLITTTLVSFADLIFDTFISYAVTVDLSQSAFVRTGYGITLGVANMFFVLILLWIAIATIFDFEPYTARSLLLKLIIAALLINFSLPIARSFVNLSNGIANIFYTQLRNTPTKNFFGGTVPVFGSSIAQRVILLSRYTALIDTSPETTKRLRELEATVAKECFSSNPSEARATKLGLYANREVKCNTAEGQKVWAEYSKVPGSSDEALTNAYQAVFWKLLFAPIVTFVLLAGTILILIRQLSLAYIFVLGPLAFLFMILPATQRFYNDWWEKLFKWSFFFPAFMFFLFISLTVGGEILPSAAANSKDKVPVLIQFTLTMGLLLGTMIVANNLGIAGASTVTGWGKGMAGWAAGTGKRIGGWTARRGLLDTPVGRAMARSKYSRWALRPLESAAAAGQKVTDTREAAARKRRAMAAKAAPAYRWALMQGMATGEKADFIRESKPHQIRQVMGIASPDEQRQLYQQMKDFDLEDKILEAMPDLNAKVSAVTNIAQTDPRFGEAFRSWIAGAQPGDIQKHVSAEDIRTNAHIRESVRDGTIKAAEFRALGHTRENAEALRDIMIDIGGRDQYNRDIAAAGADPAARLTASSAAIDRAAEHLRTTNPQVANFITGPTRINLSRGIAIGKKAPREREPAPEREEPEAPPAGGPAA